MGTIYLAVAGGLADFRKLLVVKELRQDLSANQRFVEMFLDEAKLAARLNHPNVVQTIEAGQEGDRYFLSMEFLDGQPYNAIWQSAGKAPAVSLPVRLKILSEALTGLHYAHTLTEYDGTNLHIVHRDVSPQNIFVTYDGQVKVVDFGIAKAAVSSAVNTTPGMFKGKFGYASPEQVRGHEDLDARTDVFAMGVILWETLTMRRFSDGKVDRASVGNRLNGLEPRASKVPGLDPRLAAICDRALAVDPEARFASAEEFRIALDEYLVQCGQRVEISTIKQVMATKFAAERRAVHQLIDTHIKRGAVEESHVQSSVLNSEAGNNHPTEVADLSKYIHNTANETVVSGGVPIELERHEPRVSPESNRKLLIAGIAALLAVAVSLGLLALSGSKEEAQVVPLVETRPVVTGPGPVPTAVQPTAAPPAALPVPSAPPPAAVAVQPAPAPTTALEPVPAVRPSARPAARRVTLRPRGGAPEETSAAAQQAPAAPVAEAPAPAPAAPARVEPAPAAPAKVSIGGDLNRVERSHQRREIDTEL